MRDTVYRLRTRNQDTAVVICALRANIHVMFMLQHLFLAVMSSNRAKGLYERHGLQVVDEKSGCCCCLRCYTGERVRSYISGVVP